MIITQEKNKQFVHSHDFEEVKCTIDAEDMRYVASLLRNNYSNPALAVVREISANAIDANLEAGATRSIEIKLPTSLNPSFEVRDFGGGLSQEEIFGLYSKYGKSTKRESNNYIGAFGIGKFAPLSYGESFTCISYNNGWKVSYSIFVNEDDDTKIVKLHDEPSDEPSGLSVQVAVSDDDTDNFREVVQKFFRFFSDEDMPKFLGVEDGFIQTPEYSLSAKDGSWFFLDEKNDNYYYNNYNAKLIMGRVAYPLNNESINFEKYFKDDKSRRNAETLVRSDNFCLKMPLGSVKLHHSREALEYNKATQKVICAHLNRVMGEIQEIAKEKLADSEDLWDAKRNYAKVMNAMPYNMKSIFENSFEWNGIKIDSPSFNRDYQLQDDLVITHSWKEVDSESRNGFKIRSQKSNRADCQDNFLFLIQDLDSSHGNNLRVRTLMNEDDSLEGVYVIHPKTQVAEDAVWNSWELGKVDKKHIKYTSNVNKEKPQRSGIRKKNGSRANIPLFTMTEERHTYKNSKYWENASDDIQSVDDDASSVDGHWDGQLVYVPIKNYKIDQGDFDLDAMKSRVAHINAMRETKELPKIKLFGVRTGDVKKLGSAWVNFDKFYLYFSKEIITENMKESNEIFTSIMVKNSDEENNLRHFSDDLSQVFDLEINFPKNHKITEVKYLWNTVTKTGGDLMRYVYFVRSEDSDWLEKTLEAQVNFEELSDKLNDIKASYPMLVHFARHFSSWRDMDENLQKDIDEYISLCDSQGGEA
jgi:hypothetical protein